MDIIEGCILAVITGVLILLGVVVYQGATSEKMELVKSEWECTDTKSTVQNVLVGKVMLPQTRTVCVEYKRN